MENLACFGKLQEKYIGYELGELEGLFMHFELTPIEREIFFSGEVDYQITTSFNEVKEETIVKEGKTMVKNGYIRLPDTDIFIDIETYFTRI